MSLKQRILCALGFHGEGVLDLTNHKEYCLECGRRTRRLK